MAMAYQRCPTCGFHQHESISVDHATGTPLLPGYLHDPASARCPGVIDGGPCPGPLEVGRITPDGERIIVRAGT